MFYPNALNPQRFGLETSLAFAHSNGCGIFSMCSTVIKSPDSNNKFTSLVTGDGDGKVRVWLVGSDILSQSSFLCVGVYHSSAAQSEASNHAVTRAKFINDSILVTDNNQGDIRIWCMELKAHPGRSIGNGLLPELALRHNLMGHHSGSVEVCINIGSLLVTSGGNDGNLIGWDVLSGTKIGTLSCHRGRKLIHPDTGVRAIARSPVVDVVLDGNAGRLMCMCRDGTLTEWSFAPANERANL